MTAFLAEATFVGVGAVHGALNHHLAALMGHIERGHAGGLDALSELWRRWHVAATHHPSGGESRSDYETRAEWDRSLIGSSGSPGAIGVVLARPSTNPWPDVDPCTALVRQPTPSELLQGLPATGPVVKREKGGGRAATPPTPGQGHGVDLAGSSTASVGNEGAGCRGSVDMPATRRCWPQHRHRRR